MARITKVYLLNVAIESDYKNTLYFSSKSEQTSYFTSKALSKHKYEDFSYQRKDNKIRIPADFDDVIGCNYVMYQNSAYSDKWFYAFITDIKYISDGVTEVFIETDVMQTWAFDYTVKDSFVEREHVSDDTIGAHTIPEGLETGDYICNKIVRYNKLSSNKKYIIGATVDLSNKEALESDEVKFPKYAGALYNGLFSGVMYFAYDSSAEVQGPLVALANKGQAEAVTALFTCPGDFIQIDPDKPGRVVQSALGYTKRWRTSNTNALGQNNVDKPSDIAGYKPKNNKLFTYPYCFISMTNNAGANAVYKYELFKDPDYPNGCDFSIDFAISPGCSIRLSPRYYNVSTTETSEIEVDNLEEGLVGAKFPICSWNTDVYTNWLTQNSLNMTVAYGSAALQTVSGAGQMILGNPAGGLSTIGNGAMGIASVMAEKYAHSCQPPQANGNLSAADVMYTRNATTFTAYQMSVKSEFAKIIDQFFTMYGYKVNTVKVPNKNHRSRFWYTKTIGVNIDGAIPQQDLQKIKNCYDNGITFWNPKTSTMNDYTSANNIV